MSMTLRWASCEQLPVEPVYMTARAGQQLTIRLLADSDGPALDRFLRHGLSQASKNRFGAHIPDKQSARDVCRSIGSDDTVRIVATSRHASSYDIVGYLVLSGKVELEERARYISNGRGDLVGGSSVRLAPAVADELHANGIGTAMVRFATSLANQIGIHTIVLWGGTRDDNDSGRALYEKTGFRYIGTFETNKPELKPDGPILNHDMALVVSEQTNADPDLAKLCALVAAPRLLPLNIDCARVTDIPRLLEIRHAAFSTHAPSVYSAQEVETLLTDVDENEFQDMIDNQQLFVARRDNEVVGLAGWKDSYVRHVYIDPTQTRQGIATALLEYAEADYQQRTDATEIGAGVVLYAEGFYTANGYVTVSREKAWDDSEYLEMRKNLRA